MYFIERNGKYQYSEKYRDPFTNKQKLVSVTLESKSRQAQNRARRILDERIREKTALSSSQIIYGVTLERLFDEWIKVYEQQVRKTTLIATKAILKTLLTVIDKDTLLTAINESLLSQTFDKLLFENGLSSRYVAGIKAKLNLAFKWAIKQNYMETNPLANLELSRKNDNHGTKIKDKFLEKDELEKVFEYTRNVHPGYQPIFEWLYLTGMRAGEALALDMSDIEEINGEFVAHVTGTLDYKNVSVHQQKKSEQAKTSAGTRDVVLPEKAVAIYNKQKADHATGFLFQTQNQTPQQLSALNQVLRSTKKALDLNKRLSTHTFRHTHVSNLAELGVPFYVIQERIGHENSKLLEQIYLHVTRQAKDNLKSKLSLL